MKITYEDKEYDVEPFDNLYGFKDGQIYRSFITTGDQMVVVGCMLGRLKFILDGNQKVLAVANPMFGFNNGFETFTKSEIERYSDVVQEYNKVFK